MTTVAPEPGDVIEDYEILEKMGGNMGLVFKARHRLLDKIVALKLLPIDFITDPARLARFERELRVMGQLEHPNLVTADDARIVGCWHLVAMELIEGMDLQRLVQTRGPLPVAAACEAGRQAALGLQYAHEHGLIHRDIKPSNLMLTRAGTIKVIDMGLALTKAESTAQLTQVGLVLGTMSYCPPEQFRDPAHVDIRADIYSLGCTLFHLLTGKPPYSQRTTFAEIVQAHLNEAFPSLAETRSDAPAGLEPVLARMTAKEPDSRFATPNGVAEALTPFAQGADLKRLVPPRTQQNAPARVGKTPPPPGRQTPGAGGQRAKPRWARIAVSLGLLLAIAGAVFFATKPDAVAVVLMDTTATGGVYDEDNRDGGSNAKEVAKVLKDLLPSRSLHQQPISPDWDRQDYVRSLRPHLVIIHRSAFFHTMNVQKRYGSPPQFAKPADDPRWVDLYRMADEKLINFLGYVGTVPQTHFLIYSRGTGPTWKASGIQEWLAPGFQEEWKKKIEAQFPELKGRIHTMTITRGKDGSQSFRNPETSAELLRRVTDILRLPEKRD